MNKLIKLFLFAILAMSAIGLRTAIAVDETRMNVLFLIADDLRAELGCYGSTLSKTPELDQLSAKGVRFDRAYCQFPLCNPSRSSMLTGRYPTTTGVLGNRTWFGAEHSDFISLPKYFQQQGFATLESGKIFHGGIDDAEAWTEGGRPRIYGEGATAVDAKELDLSKGMTKTQHSDRWVVLEGDGESHGDYRIADRAIAFLQKYRDRAFFLGCGFNKPHSPPEAPRRFFDLFDAATIPLPPDFAPRPIVPEGFPAGSIRPQNADLFVGRDASADEARQMIRAYLASTAWVDWNVGRVLKELDALGLRQKTIVVFWGDHGYQLGEKGKWSKAGSLWEQGARVPLIIYDPRANGNGSACPRVVESIDLYPTLCALCGLPIPKGLEGRSLAPLLNDPVAPWDHPAYTMWSEDGRGLSGIAVRKDRWRYAEFKGRGAGAMLLDDESDPHELKNVVDAPENAAIVKELSALVQEFAERNEPQAKTARRVSQSFDSDWRFLKGDTTSASERDFDDAAWRSLDVPHDWSIEGPFDRDNPAGGAGAFLPAGVGWYRKQFTLPSEWDGRRVRIEFDGVMAQSDVWINGHHLGKRPNGYVSFQYDLTDHLNLGEGQSNVIAVRVDNSKQPASRWYTGAGINRHVRLVVTSDLHVGPWGVFITTPEVSNKQAAVRIATEIENSSDRSREFRLETQLRGPTGEIAATHASQETIKPRTVLQIQHALEVDDPEVWDIDRPNLYCAVTRVFDGAQLVDEVNTPFGIRQFEFQAESGFWLNGRNLKIKGVCLHEDGGAMGTAVPKRVWESRLLALRDLGANAVRTAHNPPSPELLDLCDQLGFLVMDEFFDCWSQGKTRFDYHLNFNEWSAIDARDTIRRDRNHPSVILYSVGNEIRDTRDAENAKRILAGLIDVCHDTDPTRPVTQALFRPNTTHDYKNGLADLLDVIGTNYRDRELLRAWREKPTRKIIGTEQRHDRDTWLACRDHPEHAGQFLWAGVDYLGESHRWPLTTFNGGLLDRTGAPRPLAYERKSWWSDQPMVYAARRVGPPEPSPEDPGYETFEWRRKPVLFADWTPEDLSPHIEKIEVYSNCDEVELRLNGKSMGSQPLPQDASPRSWSVEFQPGIVTLIGRNGGQEVATHELRTAGPPARIRLVSDRDALSPAWDDVAMIEATVVDAEGVALPRATDEVSFSVEGPAVIIAVDNGSITSLEPFQARERHAEAGRCIAVVRRSAPTGPIVLSAAAAGLTPGFVRIEGSVAKSP